MRRYPFVFAVTLLFLFLAPYRSVNFSYAQTNSAIPDLGPGCALDPKTGQCLQAAPSPAMPVVPQAPASDATVELQGQISEPQKSAPKLPAVKLIPAPVIATTSIIEDTSFLGKVSALWRDPAVQFFFKKIALPFSVTLAAVSGSSLMMTVVAGNARVAVDLSRFFQSLDTLRFQILGFVRLKRRKPWGRVIEKISGSPIPGATVEIFNAEFDKLTDVFTTDADGRFEFFAVPGTYYLKVFKKGFSKKTTDRVTVHSAEQFIDLEIALAPLREGLGLPSVWRFNVFQALIHAIDVANPYLLAFGTLVSAGEAYITPDRMNWGILAVYVSLDFLKIYLASHLVRPLAVVRDKKTQLPIDLAVVRIFDARKNWLLTTKVTDRKGRFAVLVVSGEYYLTCAKEGHKPYRSDIIRVGRNTIPDFSIVLE